MSIIKTKLQSPSFPIPSTVPDSLTQSIYGNSSLTSFNSGYDVTKRRSMIVTTNNNK